MLGSTSRSRFRRRNVGCAQRAVSGMLQIHRDQLLDFRFVFDHEYRATIDFWCA